MPDCYAQASRCRFEIEVSSAYFDCIHDFSSFCAKVAVYGAKGCNDFTEDCDGFTDYYLIAVL